MQLINCDWLLIFSYHSNRSVLWKICFSKKNLCVTGIQPLNSIHFNIYITLVLPFVCRINKIALVGYLHDSKLIDGVVIIVLLIHIHYFLKSKQGDSR